MFAFFKDIYLNKRLVLSLAWTDFKARYAGSFLGIFWAFINPLVTIFIYWFVFGVGLKAGSTDGGYPFIVYLVTGIVAWFFFSDTIMNATNSFREYSYLVKKVVFNIRILPTVKLVANLFTHLFFIAITVILCALYGYYPGPHLIMIVYFLFALIMFLTGVTWITSSIQPFMPDMIQFISVSLQAIMWSCPILYSPSIFSPTIQGILRLNPLYYIVMGYRSSFLGDEWFILRWKMGLYFWAWTIAMLWIGSKLYNGLSQHFSDVL